MKFEIMSSKLFSFKSLARFLKSTVVYVFCTSSSFSWSDFLAPQPIRLFALPPFSVYSGGSNLLPIYLASFLASFLPAAFSTASRESPICQQCNSNGPVAVGKGY